MNLSSSLLLTKDLGLCWLVYWFTCIFISCSQVIILVDSHWALCTHCQLFKGERVTTSVSELQLNAEWILRGYSTKFYTSIPKFKPLTLLGTNFADKVPFSYTFNWKKVHASHSFNWPPALSPVTHVIVMKDILINSSLATRSSSCLLAPSFPLALVMLRKACWEGRLAPFIIKFPKSKFSCHFHIVPTALRWCVSLKYFYQRLFNITKWQISLPFHMPWLTDLYPFIFLRLKTVLLSGRASLYSKDTRDVTYCY